MVDMIETQVRLWAQQTVLAYLDEDPAAAQELVTQIESATSVSDRWRVAVREVATLHRGWVQIALGFHGAEMWTPEQQSAGHRAVVEKLVPEALRNQVLGQVDVLDAHEAAVSAAIAAGDPVPEHSWYSKDVAGPPTVHAAATLIAWMAEQPQVHEGVPTRIRDELLGEIDETIATLATAPQPTTEGGRAPDQDALDLIVALFHGEDFIGVPADPAERTSTHNAVVEIAAHHLREHNGAVPTAAQALELERKIMSAIGMIVDNEDALDSVPADAPELDIEDMAAVEAFAMRMLHGVLTHSAPTFRDATTAVAQYGPRGQRLARGIIEELGQVWFARLRRTVTVRTSTLIPGMQSIINRVVPEEHRHQAFAAYTPVLMKLQEEGPADLHPDPTRDIESDLYLMAAYSGWMGMHAQNQPQRIRAELAKVVAYLDRGDRTRSALDLSDEEMSQARETLRELVDRTAANQVPPPKKPLDEADRLLAAAFDAGTDSNAAAQVQRIADTRTERATALRQEARAQGRTTTPEEQAARRTAERERRAKRKKKRKG
ncbi:hypothetical protein [Amycolatopsis sp. NPDC004378]